jgi:hypothetical protein
MTGPLVLILVALMAMLTLISVRRYETAKGMRFFDSYRETFDVYAAQLWVGVVLGGIPVSWRTYARAVVHDVTHTGVRLAVEVIRAIERPLARLSYKMRVSAPKGAGAPVSDFLRTITPEKK